VYLLVHNTYYDAHPTALTGTAIGWFGFYSVRAGQPRYFVAYNKSGFSSVDFGCTAGISGNGRYVVFSEATTCG
jgi:hypothetical protein